MIKLASSSNYKRHTLQTIFGIILLYFITLSINGCSGCSKSGINKAISDRNNTKVVNYTKPEGRIQKSVVKMKKMGGVYFVPVEINGIPMEFIFDTGASDITLSATEAIFLYKQGKLTEEDIRGTQQYQIADGTLAEGTVITLKTVRIGNKTLHNVEASIVHNQEAPLLIGQSALSRFGKITIDYKNNEIRFE